MEHYRQGDVMIRRVKKLDKAVSKDLKQAKQGVLAYGEVTGHAHRLISEGGLMVAETVENNRPLVTSFSLEQDGKLVHEEHETVELPAGDYVVVRQREYTPQEIRRVAD